MLQLREVCEPQAGSAWPYRMRCRECAEVGIGKREADDIARRLRQVDCRLLPVQPVQVAREDMHRQSAAGASASWPIA